MKPLFFTITPADEKRLIADARARRAERKAALQALIVIASPYGVAAKPEKCVRVAWEGSR